MSDLNGVCQRLLKQVSGCMGVGVVEMESGLLIAVAHNVSYLDEYFVESAAAAAVDMFRGRTVTTIERLLSEQRGEEVGNLINEVQISTDSTYIFMSPVPGKPNMLVVMVTARKTNLGMGWVALRSALAEIAPHCP
jgi:predicted regulator of Ras-like GTPase activity (Roadblock/LC7/MglB family)